MITSGMIPEGIGFVQRDTKLFWLLKEVGPSIDLTWMSKTDCRRDFPPGTAGSHMAEDEDTCFAEVGVRRDAPPARTYLLCFSGELYSADYRTAGDARFSGEMYGAGHDFSRFILVSNSGEYAASGADSILRYSAPVFRADGTLKQVVGLFPGAMAKLNLQWVQPIGLDSPPIPIILVDGANVSSASYPRPPETPTYTFTR